MKVPGLLIKIQHDFNGIAGIKKKTRMTEIQLYPEPHSCAETHSWS